MAETALNGRFATAVADQNEGNYFKLDTNVDHEIQNTGKDANGNDALFPVVLSCEADVSDATLAAGQNKLPLLPGKSTVLPRGPEKLYFRTAAGSPVISAKPHSY